VDAWGILHCYYIQAEMVFGYYDSHPQALILTLSCIPWACRRERWLGWGQKIENHFGSSI